MADNVIKVSVTSTKSQRVSVSSSQQATNITASPDTGRFWSQTSKNWAVSESIVDGEDYSSKYYANKSKQFAQNAEGYSQSTRETYNTFVSDANDYRSELTELKDAGTQEINEAVASGKDEINSAKTTIINDIEFVADGEKKEIEDLADLIKENAEEIASRTSFAMFDTILKDHVLTYEESKGLALQGTYVYKEAVAGSRYGYADFYNKCLEEKEAGTATEVTLGESTITMYVNPNGHIFYDIADKQTVDDIFTSTGMAWMYGIDTENERVFLPRDNEKIHGTLIESYKSGSEWYRIYSDGWCEQGHRTASIQDTTVTWTFLKPFVDTDYNVQVTCRNSSSQYTTVRIFTTNTTSCVVGNFGINKAGKGPVDCYACGYVEIPTEGVKNPKNLYICVGNTVSESAVIDVIDVTTTENDTIPLFTGMYFDFTPNNVSWLKAGEQKNSGGVYTFCYNELVNELANPKYGLKVIETKDMISGVDYSEYWKVNQDEMTFATPNIAGLFPNNRILVAKKEATSEDTTWYNLYSDGWVEQGGTDTATATVQFLKPFIDTDYYFNAMKYGTDDANATEIQTVSKTKNSIKVVCAYSGSDLDRAFMWEAKGYTQIPIVSEYTENVNLYFKVANAVQNLELLDVGKVMEAVADKISHQDCKSYVTETYKNGTSWYRVWSDGWCEQGGRCALNEVATTTITLLKPYKDTNYSVSAVSITASTAGDTEAGLQCTPKSTTQITVTAHYINPNNQTACWEAKGYIA